jgi:CO/xanthine dehydrogenase FAD-binding subunit
MRKQRLSAGSLVLSLAAVLTTAIGCQPAYRNALIGADGTPIRLEAVQAILGNGQLTEDEKRQALRDIGITDEALIDVLLG